MYEYFDLANLPVLDPHRRMLQVSSFDRQYENADWGQYLYEEDGAYILFDERGRGCIKSIWMAVTSDETALEFYFDGETSPRWTTTARALFCGGIKELSGVGCSFEERGHYDEDDCHAGNCFIEIPFERGLKIAARGEKKLFYHIIYETYADCEHRENGAGKDGEVGKAADGSAYMCRAFEGKPYEFPRECESVEINTVLKKGYTTFLERDGAGVIREFILEVDENARLDEIYLDMDWDGVRASQVSAPLSHLFAQPLGNTDIASYPVTSRVENGRRIMSFMLPMPFWKSASGCIVNQSGEEISAKITLKISDNPYDRRCTGYFCTEYENGKTQLFSDWKIGEFGGRGRVVGLVQTCIGGQYCEGNEHFYINVAKTPRINGTGTEDLYLACYWPNFKYDSPCAGCVNDVFLENGSTLPGAFKTPAGYYRWFLDAPVEFENGIRLFIQHGAVCQTYSDYSTLCLSYRLEEPSLFETDIINLESESSKALHAYSADASAGEEYTHEARLESDMRAPLMRRRGYRTAAGGSVIFKVCILPDNDGAVIRRLYDQTESNRGAEVYVDGKFAGVWNCPGENKHFGFADDDFYIPSRLCRGKELLDIEIRSGGFYTDFEYRIFTRKIKENEQNG